MLDPIDVLVYGNPYQLGGVRELSFFSDGSVEGVRVQNLYELMTVPSSEPKLETLTDAEIREVVIRDHWQDSSFRRDFYEKAKRDLLDHPKVKFWSSPDRFWNPIEKPPGVEVQILTDGQRLEDFGSTGGLERPVYLVLS